nr:MAG TPA: putative tail-component [Caudoviricetes sp.]
MEGGIYLNMDVSGLAELIQDLKSAGDDVEELEKDMLNAAGEELEEEWKEQINRHGFVKTGAMQDHVSSKYNYKAKTVITYPKGKSKSGGGKPTSNAVKAYVLHHGREPNSKGNGGIKASYFVDDVRDNGEKRAATAMNKVVDDFLKGKGL